MTPTLYHGACAPVLQNNLGDGSVDLIYADPPFGNGEEWAGKAGKFSDRWKTSPESQAGWQKLSAHNRAAVAVFEAAALGDAERAYLGCMVPMFLECRRVLKKTGTFWLHHDDTMGCYLRLLGAAVFGLEAEIGTLVWKRTAGGHGNGESFARVHDTIACWGRSPAARWRLWRLGLIGGEPLCSGWNWRFDDYARAAPLGATDNERVDYPTQKPVALLEEIISNATLRGDTVLDPCCGSGTTLVAAHGLGRVAIGVDISPDAIAASRARLSRFAGRQMGLFEGAA